MVYDCYGLTSPDILAARSAVERALGVALQGRDSAYLGE
jgi:hypothetical protein